MINGGFFVLSPKVIDYIDNDQTIWKQHPLEKLAQEIQLPVFKHEDFWQPMDTLRDKMYLEELWQALAFFAQEETGEDLHQARIIV